MYISEAKLRVYLNSYSISETQNFILNKSFKQHGLKQNKPGKGILRIDFIKKF